jgi:hypothetical protein
MDDAPAKFPPEEWFAAVAEGHPQRVAFRDINGETEFVQAEWIEENVFWLGQLPLLVDGVCRDDNVEVEWREGEIEPHFLRNLTDPDDEWSCRVVRSHATPGQVKEFTHLYQKRNFNFIEATRYERGIFVAAVSPRLIKYSEEVWETKSKYLLADLLPGKWVFTDTGTQE